MKAAAPAPQPARRSETARMTRPRRELSGSIFVVTRVFSNSCIFALHFSPTITRREPEWQSAERGGFCMGLEISGLGSPGDTDEGLRLPVTPLSHESPSGRRRPC